MFGKRHEIDAEAAGDFVAETLARERPEYDGAAMARQQLMLTEAAWEAGLSDAETRAATQALLQGYQERTKK